MELFQKHFTTFGSENITVVASPFMSMMADHLKMNHNTLRRDECFHINNKYKNIIIDIYDGIIYPHKKKSDESYWFSHSIELLNPGGRLKARIPSYVLQKLGISNPKFSKRRNDTFKINVESIYIDNEYAIVELKKENPTGKTKVEYNSGEIIYLSSDKLVVLKKYNKTHYDYINNVTESSAFEFQATNTQRGSGKKQNFKQQFEMFCGNKWNKNQILIKRNGDPQIKVYKYNEVKNEESRTSRDVFYLESEKNVNAFINLFRNEKFIDFVNNMSYNNFGRISSLCKRLLFNKEILKFKF